jgi:hypothetical protein
VFLAGRRKRSPRATFLVRELTRLSRSTATPDGAELRLQRSFKYGEYGILHIVGHGETPGAQAFSLCRLALEYGHCSGSSASPALTGLFSMYRQILPNSQ